LLDGILATLEDAVDRVMLPVDLEDLSARGRVALTALWEVLIARRVVVRAAPWSSRSGATTRGADFVESDRERWSAGEV
jgi:hypothetical protein